MSKKDKNKSMQSHNIKHVQCSHDGNSEDNFKPASKAIKLQFAFYALVIYLGCASKTLAQSEEMKFQDQWQKEQLAIQSLEKHGGHVETSNRVPKSLRKLVDKDKQEFVRKVTIRPNPNMTRRKVNLDLLNQLKEFSYLRELDLGAVALTDEAMKSVSKLTRLRVLRINADQLTDRAMEEIDKLSQLEKLQIDQATSLSDRSLKQIGRLNKLKHLTICVSTKITGSAFAEFKRPDSLQQLNLPMCRGLDDSGLKGISRFKNLQVLSINGSRKVSSTGVLHVAKLKQLKELTLGALADKAISAQTVEAISHLDQLKLLSLTSSQSLTNEAVKHLTKLKKLQTINLSSTAVTDACLNHLRKCKNLKKLTLYNNEMTDSTIRKFSSEFPKIWIEHK